MVLFNRKLIKLTNVIALYLKGKSIMSNSEFLSLEPAPVSDSSQSRTEKDKLIDVSVSIGIAETFNELKKRNIKPYLNPDQISKLHDLWRSFF